MNASVKEILDSFEQLPESEKRELVSEILRRTVELDYPNLTEDELVYNAEEIFLELDSREAENG
jgi:hypothetical protein